MGVRAPDLHPLSSEEGENSGFHNRKKGNHVGIKTTDVDCFFFLVHLPRYPVVKAVPQSQICLTWKTMLLNTTSLNMFAFPCVLIYVLGPT